MLFFKHTEILILLNQTLSVSLTSVLQVKTTQIDSFFYFALQETLKMKQISKFGVIAMLLYVMAVSSTYASVLTSFFHLKKFVLKWNVPLIRGKAAVERNPTLFQITHNYQGRRYLAPLKKNNHILSIFMR